MLLSSRRAAGPFAAALPVIGLIFAGCGEQLPGSTNDDLTSAEAVERTLELKGYVYVASGASASTIQSEISRQVRTAFGPLRIAKISVDDREFRHNVASAQLSSQSLDLVRKQSGTVTKIGTVQRVSYTYKARALVHKSKADKTSLSVALLMGNYQGFVSEILEKCVENVEHDRDFASSFWYVWSPAETGCQALISKEVEEINAARTGLAENQLSEREYGRRYLPLNAKFIAPASAAPTSYPEYDRLYGLGESGKTRLVVYNILGLAAHDDDPADEQHENDMGFLEYFKLFKNLSDKWGSSLKVLSSSQVSPLSFTYDGNTYTATFNQLHQWVVSQSGFPSGVSDTRAFRRAIHDHIKLKWINLEVPFEVTGRGTTKKITLEIRSVFGTESGWGMTDYFRQAFKNGDVVLYDGHSYIGSGPLDPYNFSRSDFKSGYQILFFNSCVSFNYYGVNYFAHKAAGSQDLDLVTNGIEVWIQGGGASLGQFIVALFDGSQRTWRSVLEATRYKTYYSGYHDPNRNVDGETDNKYNPTQTPIQVKVGSGGGGGTLAVQNTTASCGKTVSGTIELSATSATATKVTFLANGRSVGTVSSAPFKTSWNTTQVADGAVTLTARAQDASGATAEASCSLTVQNGGGGGDLFFDNLDGSTSGWTATGLWHLAAGSTCASPGYASATKAWYFGNDASCTYKASGAAKGMLTSPAIDGVTEGSKLSFQYYRVVEQASDGAYDKTEVQVAVDGSSSWQSLWSKDSKSTSYRSWKASGDLSLAAFAGKRIRVRFVFDSVDDYSNDYVGWLIDDIRVTR
ncbi:MAG: hypothetical protein IT371_24980 [Deltaproteobacteria bacterium]|nr:hypothetical protein [Deltaproteobacteria bacterium]